MLEKQNRFDVMDISFNWQQLRQFITNRLHYSAQTKTPSP